MRSSHLALVSWLRWPLLLVALATQATYADTRVGKVVAIADGDTLSVLVGKERYKIRLAGIDAPEEGQSFGAKSKQSLAQLAFNRSVKIEYHKIDRYGRIVGKVLVDGADVNLEQIRRGLAWHYKAYELEQTKDDRTSYATAEAHAREKRSGLWADEHAIAPWTWRALRRAK